MKEEVAPGVWRIPVMPLGMINCYVLDDVLVDAGVRSSGAKILAAVKGMRLSAHALTHAHPDHQGASAQLCQKRDIPLWCGEGDREVVESGNMRAQYRNPNGWIARAQNRLLFGPRSPGRSRARGGRPDRRLRRPRNPRPHPRAPGVLAGP